MSEETSFPWKSETEFYDMHSEKIFSEFRFYHFGMLGHTDKDFLLYVMQKLKVTTRSKFLDLGCGSGYLAGNLALQCESWGISTSAASIEGCRRRYPRATFEVANMESFFLKMPLISRHLKA